MNQHFLTHTYSLYQTFQLSLNYIVYKRVLRNDQVKLENKVTYYLYESSQRKKNAQYEIENEILEAINSKDSNHPKHNSIDEKNYSEDAMKDIDTKDDSVKYNKEEINEIQEKEKNEKAYLDKLILEMIEKLNSNRKNLPNVLLIEVQHGEIAMDTDTWMNILENHMHTINQTQKESYDKMQDIDHNENETKGFGHLSEVSLEDSSVKNVNRNLNIHSYHSNHSKNTHPTNTKNKRDATGRIGKSNSYQYHHQSKKSLESNSFTVFRIDYSLKANETIHNYIVKESQSLYRNLLYSSLDFIQDLYTSIIVVIDSRVVSIEKISQWLRVAKRYHNKLQIWTVIEVKRHDMLLNALPDTLVQDFQFELMKKSPSKREVFFTLITHCVIDQHRDIPFKLSHQLLEVLIDACTIKNDDVNYFITFLTSVMEMMVSTQPLFVLLYYAKFNYDDPAKHSGELDIFLSGITIEELKTIVGLPSIKNNEEFINSYTSLSNNKDDTISRKSIEDFLKNSLHTLLASEEFNIIMLDCFLSIWRCVRGYKTLYDPEIYSRSFKYSTQRIILYRDFLKHRKFLKTKMMRAAKQYIEDIGLTYKMYSNLLSCFENLFTKHSELEGKMKENMEIVTKELKEEFYSNINDIIPLKSSQLKNISEALNSKEFENVKFSSSSFLELIDMLDEVWVHHYTELPLWELYYADPIDSQKRLQDSSMDESILTIEDWMNTTMAHNHRIQLLYAHHSVDSELSKVFKGMRLGGNNENAQYESYLNESKHQDKIETQRQWYKWMKTIKGAGLR